MKRTNALSASTASRPSRRAMLCRRIKPSSPSYAVFPRSIIAAGGASAHIGPSLAGEGTGVGWASATARAYGGPVKVIARRRPLPFVAAILVVVALLASVVVRLGAPPRPSTSTARTAAIRNSGTSLGSAFKTIKAGMWALRYGGTLDVVGYDDYVYYEQMTGSQWFINGSASSPIVIRAHGYGSGSYVRPIVSGAKVVSRPGPGRVDAAQPDDLPEPLEDQLDDGHPGLRIVGQRVPPGADLRRRVAAAGPPARAPPGPASRRRRARSTGTARRCTCGSAAGGPRRARASTRTTTPSRSRTTRACSSPRARSTSRSTASTSGTRRWASASPATRSTAWPRTSTPATTTRWASTPRARTTRSGG